MSTEKFRLLREDEIELRVNTISQKGVSLLLYKDARCDMNILDETVGADNWQRKHYEVGISTYCAVDIWDDEKKLWVSKSDVGEQSKSHEKKGEASDGFKRACFNWGIGRELYTAPFIWVKADNVTFKEVKGKQTTYDKFSVKEITYIDRKIDGLAIVNQKGVLVYYRQPKKEVHKKSKSDKNDIGEYYEEVSYKDTLPRDVDGSVG